MIKNYLKIAFRNLWKNRSYAFINIFGLSIAFGCAILLFLTAHFEFTFDDFQAGKDRIFKVYFKINHPEKVEYRANLHTPLTPALKSEYDAEIRYATRLMGGGTQVVKGEKIINQDLEYVDKDYLKMFSFKMIEGDADKALDGVNNVVLNQETAEKIFGEAEAMGQTISLNFGGKIENYVVTGIMEKAPLNSTIDNNMLLRFEKNPEYQNTKDQWDSDYHDIYVQLADHVKQDVFEKRLRTFTAKYYKETIQQLKKDGAQPDEAGEVKSLRFLPLPEVHFNKNVGGGGAIDAAYPYILLIISGLVILIACINFINLSIARSLSRAREVGMRKALGALKSQILGQFWGEAFIICLLAFALGTLIATSLMPAYNGLFKSHLSFGSLLDPVVIGLLVLGFLLITFIAGGYPAMSVTKFNTVEVLKGKVKISARSGGIRSSLIVAQFSIAILLMTCTMIIWKQINYLQNMPLGFDKEHVVSIPVGVGVPGEKILDFMRNELANDSRILDISGADINIGRGKDGSGFKSVFGFEMGGKSYKTNGLNIDYDYTKTLGLKIVAGRDFSRQFAGDKDRSIVINETMAKQLGFKDPIGRNIPLGDSLGKNIVGVVKDYHFESLKAKIEPMTYFLQSDFGIAYIFVKVAPESPAETMKVLERAFKQIAPKAEFMPSFLDENTNNQYKKEERMSQIVMSAAILTILLSCLGLFAITIMIISQRTKEIGIRKVLGASIPNLVGLLSKDFLSMVLIAIVIASPIAWYLMNMWLQDYEYKTQLSWWVFAVIGVVTLIIAFCTVSFQSVKAALMNPVKSLKSE